jgi:hypothetical protein
MLDTRLTDRTERNRYPQEVRPLRKASKPPPSQNLFVIVMVSFLVTSCVPVFYALDVHGIVDPVASQTVGKKLTDEKAVSKRY